MIPPPRIDRRTALKWMLTAAASTALAPHLARAAAGPGTAAAAAAPGTQGYGTDPDMMKTYRPGEVWPLTLTDEQRITAAALCDVIMPADETSPAASAVGVVDFLDEWISAPYPRQQQDRAVILPGLAWLEAESARRFAARFARLDAAQQTALCDDICLVSAARPEFKAAARFFALYRDLTAGGYYTTPAGRQAIGYVGNMPLATFDGPPPEVLRQAGLL